MFRPDAVFVDTNGWIAILNSDDSLYAKACDCLSELGSKRRPLVTTDWVLAETGNGLARTAARQCLAAAVRRFLESPHCHLIQINRALLERAIERYDHSEDKTWGLIDCASFVVMQDQGMVDAFTSDRHFTQAGFHCLI
jgi:predicted nucleic acid-binding protein